MTIERTDRALLAPRHKKPRSLLTLLHMASMPISGIKYTVFVINIVHLVEQVLYESFS